MTNLGKNLSEIKLLFFIAIVMAVIFVDCPLAYSDNGEPLRIALIYDSQDNITYNHKNISAGKLFYSSSHTGDEKKSKALFSSRKTWRKYLYEFIHNVMLDTFNTENIQLEIVDRNNHIYDEYVLSIELDINQINSTIYSTRENSSIKHVAQNVEGHVSFYDVEGNIIANQKTNFDGNAPGKFWASEIDIEIGYAIQKIALKILDILKNDHVVLNYLNETKIKNESPAHLVTTYRFSDISSFRPNTTINAAENSIITGQITNSGEGIAFDVTLQVESKFSGISTPDEITIGDIKPGESKEISIPVKADISLKTGTASFLITADEKRGYDARPVELQVPTADLQKPELMLASCNLNDSSGLGQGDGDNQPENNEIIELAPYVRNDGVGAGLQVKIELVDVTPGIDVLKDSDDLAVIEPGSLGKTTLAFKVPRTFSGPEIKYTVVARDVRGMETSQTYKHAFTSSSPQLQYSYQVVDNRNREIPSLENGKSYTVRLTPKNGGNNVAEGVKVKVRASSSKVDVGNYSGAIGTIDSGSQGGSISIPVTLSRSFTDRVLELDVAMTQDSFPGFDQKISLPVKVTQPKLDYQVVLLNGLYGDTLTENSQPKFRVSVSNNGSLDAENVEIKFQSTHDIASIDEKQIVGTIKAGESQYKDFTFHVRGGTKLGKLPITVKVSQSDFDNLDEIASFNIVKQTAIVQKVEGSSSPGITGKVAYSGPPEVYINSPNNNIEVLEETVDLRGSVITFGAGNAAEKISIIVNGKPLNIISVDGERRLRTDIISKWSTGNNKIVFDGELILGPENNEIKIVCTDRNNQKSEQIIHVNKKAKLGNIYAVVVGVSNFHNQSYNLSYAASDARKFYDFLLSDKGGALPENRIKLLIDEQANRAAIINALEKFLGQASRDDTVEIYFATHGVLDVKDNKLYYLAYNTDVDSLRATGISNKEFEDIINTNIKAGKIVLYLDACHSGKSGLSDMYAGRRGIAVEATINQQLNGLAAELSKAANGVTSFSASSASGSSLEDPKWGGGVFTYSLLKGLNGEANENNDEWVSVGELDKYLTSEVLIETSGDQSPKVNGTLLDVTPIAKVR